MAAAERIAMKVAISGKSSTNVEVLSTGLTITKLGVKFDLITIGDFLSKLLTGLELDIALTLLGFITWTMSI